MVIVVADPDRTGSERSSEPAASGSVSGPGSEPVREVVAVYARALGGEAHRIRVRLEEKGLPEVLDIAIPGSTGVARYRLLHAPRTRRPITDNHGDYLYLPQLPRPWPTRTDPR